jgi:hypothetical protein
MVVGFQNFHIIVVAQDFCDKLENFKHDVHTNAHVGSKDTGDTPGKTSDIIHFLSGKSRTADNNSFLLLCSHFQMPHRSFMTCKINDHIAFGKARIEITFNGDSSIFQSQNFSHIPAHSRVIAPFYSRSQINAALGFKKADYSAAHPSAGSGYNGFHHNLNSL